jgi:hypothetical protein
LGAYRIPPETGLLIPCDFVKYQSTSVEQTEEAKPVNLGPQIAKAYGVTLPQRDFV